MSVLKWESNDENDCTLAETMQGEYMVCELNGGGWDCMFRDWQLDSKIYETKQAAMDACEVHYIARCTEFLTLYNPATHVVVSREAAEVAANEVQANYCGHSSEWGKENDIIWHSDQAKDVHAELRAALEGGR
jgi:hypothetical protein